MRKGNVTIHFIPLPRRKRNRYGLGTKIRTFKNGGEFTVSTLASDCVLENTTLIHALIAIGVKDPEKHTALFMTLH